MLQRSAVPHPQPKSAYHRPHYQSSPPHRPSSQLRLVQASARKLSDALYTDRYLSIVPQAHTHPNPSRSLQRSAHSPNPTITSPAHRLSPPPQPSPFRTMVTQPHYATTHASARPHVGRFSALGTHEQRPQQQSQPAPRASKQATLRVTQPAPSSRT
jgi:hypothetical protein